uniref:Uncharacterized protein n=1 Tax=Tanacetum cinerariifolium TaxID=118510 RepID=A0A699GQG2_TANCI|nr:hypothetical protein [Tanacetum cinerariifolium]
MNHGFLDARRRNNKHRKKTTTDTGTCLASGSDGILNYATPCVNAAMKVVSVVEETVAMECPAVNTLGVGPNPPPPTQEANASAGNVPGKPSYATATGKPSRKKVNVRTLFTPGVAYPVVANYVRNTGGKYGLVRSMFSLSTRLFSFQFSSINGLDAMLENGRSSYARVMIELRADVELKDNIVMAMPKITKEGHYTCNVRVEYEWEPPSSSGNKKKGVEPTVEVSNLNPFDALNSVDNDVEFGTIRGTTNLVNNEDTSSGSSFMYIDNDGEFASNTPIGEKIDKIERQICKGKLRSLDNDENSLVLTGIVESDSGVEVVFDETANLRISTSGNDGSDKGYGTNSLLEQWRDSYPDNDYYDPYDDDLYQNYDFFEYLQSICDYLDITVCGRKKK